MILYLLKSVFCLALLLFFYHILLKKEKMYTFNRFYLLGSIVFSFLAPLTIITTDKSIEEPIVINETLDISVVSDNTTPIIIKQTFDYAQLLMGIYIIICCVLLIRFARNLFKIINKIKQNEQVNHKNAILVLVDDNILPHTFWKSIFINKNDYYTHKIEEELFTHELTHVTQKHTLDVLIIEFIQALFWINPLFIFLKQSVQLNHEFLADESVINTYKNTFQYQYLLLNKAAWKNEYYLASNLNYSLTKKRLEMMTIQSSPTKILLKKLAVIPLLIGFIFLFAEKVEANEKKDMAGIKETEVKLQKNLGKNSFIFPIDKKFNPKISSKFGLRKHPILKIKKMHQGIDIIADKNANISSIDDGKVIDISEKDIAYGKYVIVAHNNGWQSFYAHMKSISVKKNQVLHKGEKIGVIGNTGRSIQTHLHFEISKNQIRVNPLKFFKIKNLVKNQKKEYIDSPIPKTTFYKQSVSNERPILTTTIKADKETDTVTVKDIRLKLKDVNALKISYKDTILKKKSATKAQMKEYESIIAKRKKADIFKEKEINKIKEIYKLMSDKQKESVVNVDDFIKNIPILKPKPDWVFTYQRLANRIKTNPKNRKANNAYLKEIYKNKMNNDERTKVSAPENILLPPPPKNHLDQVIDMAKKGATFYYEGKVINSDKAIALLKKNKNLNIHSESTNYNNYKVWISKTPNKK